MCTDLTINYGICDLRTYARKPCDRYLSDPNSTCTKDDFNLTYYFLYLKCSLTSSDFTSAPKQQSPIPTTPKMRSVQEGPAEKLVILSQFHSDASEDAWNTRMKRTVGVVQKKLGIVPTFKNIKKRVGSFSLGLGNVRFGARKRKDKMLGPVKRLCLRPSSSGTVSVKAVSSASSSQSSASEKELFAELSPAFMPPCASPPRSSKLPVGCCGPLSPSAPASPTTSSTYSPIPPPIPERSHLRPVWPGHPVPKREKVVEQRKESKIEDGHASEAWAADYLELLGVHPAFDDEDENKDVDGQIEKPLSEVAISERDSVVSSVNGSRSLGLQSDSDLERGESARGPCGIVESAATGDTHSDHSDDITPKYIVELEISTQTAVDARHESPQQAHCINWSCMPKVTMKKATGTAPPNSGSRKNEMPRRVAVLRQRLRRAARRYRFQSLIRRVREEQKTH